MKVVNLPSKVFKWIKKWVIVEDDLNNLYIKNKPVILFAIWSCHDLSIPKKCYRNYLKKYLKEINDAGNVEVVMKLHPRDRDVRFYKSIVKDLGYNNIKVIKTEGRTQTKAFLYTLIRDSDLVISFGSSVSMEALIIGTPSIIIDLIDLPNAQPIMKEGVLHVHRNTCITKVVKELI